MIRKNIMHVKNHFKVNDPTFNQENTKGFAPKT